MCTKSGKCVPARPATYHMPTVGPLHPDRFRIVDEMQSLPLQQADILYRSSDAQGPFGLPFSRLVGWMTHSPFTHAALAFLMPTTDGAPEPFVVEQNSEGMSLVRLVDWVDLATDGHVAVYRLKDSTAPEQASLVREMRRFLNEDPDYDFTFSDPKKFYCTEMVATVYDRAGLSLGQPEKIEDIVPRWGYHLLRIGNVVFRSCSSASIPFDRPVYYPGDENRGLMASPRTTCVYRYQPVQKV